jgi:hypothetical protein
MASIAARSAMNSAGKNPAGWFIRWFTSHLLAQHLDENSLPNHTAVSLLVQQWLISLTFQRKVGCRASPLRGTGGIQFRSLSFLFCDRKKIRQDICTILACHD